VTSLTIVGAPTSAGAYAPGQEDGPAALREQGIAAALAAAGVEITDAGDVERFRWRPDPDSPRAANAAAVADRARRVAERVAAATGRVLVLGGDCTVGVGTVAGLALRGARPGLVYFDRHADLNVPDSTIDGALDWMGVAHMLDVHGCTDGLAAVGGDRPLLEPARLAYLGLGRISPPEQAVIDARRPAVVALERAIADPRGAAGAALEALDGCDELALHFDVDVLDFLETPLAENTDRAPGVPLAAAGAILATLLADPRAMALTITELNPHHGAEDGSTLRRLVGAVAAAYAGAVHGGH
jgi:arginase